MSGRKGGEEGTGFQNVKETIEIPVNGPIIRMIHISGRGARTYA